MNVDSIQNLLNHGRYLEARTKAEEALTLQPDIRLHQLYALALSKSGASEEALAYLEPHYHANPDDSETAGIMGSIYKELFKKNQRTSFAIQARDTYLKNFQTTQNYYTGINAAAMSAMVMQSSKVKEIAKQITELLSPDTTDFWETVTLAEAYLLTKDKTKAIEYYAKAKRMAATDWGKTASVNNQLWLLNHYIPVPNQVLEIFTPPRVVAFSGHMIDHPNRKTPRFPAEIEPKIKAAIAAHIQSSKLQIGFCSLACGSDIIFAETMLELGGEVHVSLPFDVNDFKEVSLSFAGEGWVERFNNLIEKLPCTLISREHYKGNDDVFALMSKIIFGAAVLESHRYHNEPYLLSVLAETDLKRKEGGTRDALKHWPFPKNMFNVNPEAFFSSSVVQNTEEVPSNAQSLQEEVPSVQYYMLLDTTAMIEFDRKAFEKIIVAMEDKESIDKINLGETKELLLFNSETKLFIRLRTILDATKKFSRWKIALHVGPVIGKALGGESLNVLQEISSVALPSTVYCSHPVAALLALQSNSFTASHSGIISNENKESQTVYNIHFKTNN